MLSRTIKISRSLADEAKLVVDYRQIVDRTRRKKIESFFAKHRGLVEKPEKLFLRATCGPGLAETLIDNCP